MLPGRQVKLTFSTAQTWPRFLSWKCLDKPRASIIARASRTREGLRESQCTTCGELESYPGVSHTRDIVGFTNRAAVLGTVTGRLHFVTGADSLRTDGCI